MRIIAEIGNAHNGDLREAVAYIRACAEANVWAVKFQLHEADADGIWHRNGRPIFHPQDVTRSDYWKRIAFTDDQWRYLRDVAHDQQLNFGISFFHKDTPGKHGQINPDFWKTPCDRYSELVFGNDDLPIVASFSRYPGRAVQPNVMLRCTPIYPCACWQVIESLSEDDQPHEWDGISSHTSDAAILQKAFEQRCNYCEIHVTWSRRQLHPDACCSLTMDELIAWDRSQSA